jgi:hypothetical protein
MKTLLILTLCLLSSVTAFAADNGYKVIYEGGSIEGVKAGNKAELFIGSNEIRLVRDGKESVSIPTSAVTEISYGQDVHRRVGQPSVSLWSRSA